jgi:hypothetical protein
VTADPTPWVAKDEPSLDKEKAKRCTIYYAYPADQRYGYFSSTNKAARDAFLAEVNGKLKQSGDG